MHTTSTAAPASVHSVMRRIGVDASDAADSAAVPLSPPPPLPLLVLATVGLEVGADVGHADVGVAEVGAADVDTTTTASVAVVSSDGVVVVAIFVVKKIIRPVPVQAKTHRHQKNAARWPGVDNLHMSLSSSCVSGARPYGSNINTETYRVQTRRRRQRPPFMDAELAKAWTLRRISIVNAATVVDAEDGHNYRHFVAGALRAFARQWATHPHLVATEFGRHVCKKTCRMFEFVPSGRCSGDVFVCWASGDIHVCTKDLCRHTEPQHGFPGYNNARRAVCHVCALTRRVFSVNPDQTIGSGGGGGDEDDDVDAGAGAGEAVHGGGGSSSCCVDGGRALMEYDSETAVPEPAPAPAGRRKRQTTAATNAEDATGPSSKRKRATAATAAAGPSSGASSTHRQILHGTDCDNRERRIRIYAGLTRRLMPDAPIASVNQWVHTMEHMWAVIQRSPGFERNNSQLQPRLFALVCLNYMRNIGLSTKTLGGARLIRVLPAVPYIREHMADIKHIGEHGFTQAERALMCCMNELPAAEKMRLEFDDKAYASLYSFCGWSWRGFVCVAFRLIGVHTVHQFDVGLRPQCTRQLCPGGLQLHGLIVACGQQFP